jgi:DNA repair photolyase
VGEVQLQQLLNKDNKVQLCTLDFPENIINLDRKNEFGISLISLDEDVRNELEPNSPSYLERISCLKDLHDCGFKTFVNLEINPKIKLESAALSKLLKIVSFVDKILIKKSSFDIDGIVFNGYYNTIVDYCNKNYIKYSILD